MRKECSTVSFKNQVIYVGIDVHKSSWQVSIRHCRHHLANFSMNPDALKLAEHLRQDYPEAEYRSVYEAGFCGFEIHRSLCGLGDLEHCASILRMFRQAAKNVRIRMTVWTVGNLPGNWRTGVWKGFTFHKKTIWCFGI